MGTQRTLGIHGITGYHDTGQVEVRQDGGRDGNFVLFHSYLELHQGYAVVRQVGRHEVDALGVAHWNRATQRFPINGERNARTGGHERCVERVQGGTKQLFECRQIHCRTKHAAPRYPMRHGGAGNVKEVREFMGAYGRPLRQGTHLRVPRQFGKQSHHA